MLRRLLGLKHDAGNNYIRQFAASAARVFYPKGRGIFGGVFRVELWTRLIRPT